MMNKKNDVMMNIMMYAQNTIFCIIIYNNNIIFTIVIDIDCK